MQPVFCLARICSSMYALPQLFEYFVLIKTSLTNACVA